MGRRKKYIQISLRIKESQKEEIERISIKRDMLQQEVMRMMLELGIDCHKDMEKVGIISAVDFGYFVKSCLKDKLKKSGSKQLLLV